MRRDEYLARVIRLYRDAPDTPARPRRADWAIAGSFHQRRIPLEVVEHAIRLATLRRHLRDPASPPLERIRSLAYFRPLVEQLARDPLDGGYVEYVAGRYRVLVGKRAAKRPESRLF